MEEEKAAAYYDELTRKGEGAARYKQGLGYSSNSSYTFSLRTTFVPASSQSASASESQDQSQILHSIQNKLRKNRDDPSTGRDGRSSHRSREEKEDEEGRFSGSRDRYRDSLSHMSRHSRRRSSSREGRESYSGRSRERSGRDSARRRSRSMSSDGDKSPKSRRHHRDSSRRSRSPSPRHRRSGRERVEGRSEKNVSKRDRSASTIDYAQLIEGYAGMTPAERVKAKMKLQLSQTAAKDTTMGMATGWERFDFNKEAPLDDEEIEVAEDDAELVKDLGRSFRFSAVEAKREADTKAAHDEAIFGTSTALPIVEEELSPEENSVKEDAESCENLMSDQLLTKQQGSWRDRARKFRDG